MLYVLVALAGGILLLTGAPNLALSGMAFSISIAVPFLNMTKQFAGNINQVSQQVNAVVMGLAGARRILDLMDERPEEDEGYVTLVNAREKRRKPGRMRRTHRSMGLEASHSDGSVTYTRLTGGCTAV